MTQGYAVPRNDISITDGAHLDAFGRFRVGQPFPIFDNKNLYHRNSNHWCELTSGGTETLTHLPNESSIALTIGTASGEYIQRTTERYFAYVPGKSQFIAMTAILAATKTNLVQRVGYFDNDNGLFMELAGSTLKVVRRTKTSGAVVDNAVNQADWNIDPMDGTGPSGITIDITKAHIFVIDFQWLGVGRVRYGFDIDGILYYCHELRNANNLNIVYMSTPTLPLRYEIRNVGITASSSTMKEICCSISSEGGYTLPGLEFAASNGITTRAVTTRLPVLAIRLKTSFGGKDNRKTVKILSSAMYAQTNAAFFELVHVHDPTAITATWVSAHADSAVEYSTDITAVTGNPAHVVLTNYTPAGTGNNAQTSTGAVDTLNLHSFLNQDCTSANSQMFVLYATSFTGTTNVSTALTWIEFD